MARRSKAQMDAIKTQELEIAAAIAEEGENMEGVTVAEHPAIAKIKAERKTEDSSPVVVEESSESKPSHQFVVGDYTLQYFDLPTGECIPRLLVDGQLFFSGWACLDRNAAKSLLVALYYQMSGELKGTQKVFPIDLLASHPLNRLIYPDDNIANIRKSLDSKGNLTQLYPVVVNPLGLVLSGNSRLLALEQIQQETGKPQQISANISEGTNDLDIILSGNHQRVKTTTEMINEAMTAAAAKGTKQYLTNVRNAYIALGGAGGSFDAGWAVKKFLKAGGTNEEFNESVASINESSPTVAYELTKIAKAEEEGVEELAAEINKMARGKNAQPINPDLAYKGLSADIAKIRDHYTGETPPAIARELTLATPEIRAKLIAEKVAGDKTKLSIRRLALEAEADVAPNPNQDDPNNAPDWNAINDAEAGAQSGSATAPASGSASATPPAVQASTAPAPTGNAAYFQEMRALGYHEADCWITNLETAEAFNNAIGGVADVDPYGEIGQHIKADRIILATEKVGELDSWGGGTHAKETGLTVATALPLKSGGMAGFAEIMRRIEQAEVDKAVFSCDATLLFYPRIAAYFKALPLAYILVSRESAQEATGGFGYEPSPFVHSNPRYKTITADSWNERALSYAIVYYGNDYEAFEASCGKFGIVSYTPKAAVNRSIAFDWTEDSQGNLSASHMGVQYTTDTIGDTIFLIVDGVRQPEKYRRVEDAKRAALLHSLTGE